MGREDKAMVPSSQWENGDTLSLRELPGAPRWGQKGSLREPGVLVGLSQPCPRGAFLWLWTWGAIV